MVRRNRHRGRRRRWAGLALFGLPLAACSLFNDLGNLKGDAKVSGGSGGTTLDADYDGAWPDGAGTGGTNDAAKDAVPDTEIDATIDSPVDSPPDVPVDTGSTYADTVLQDDPVLYWRLDETAGPTAVDSSAGQLHPGTYVGAVAYSQPGAIAGDGAIVLNGGWIEAGDIFDFAGIPPFSLEAWVRPSSQPTNYARILTKDVDNPRDGWDLIADDQPQPNVTFERWNAGSLDIASVNTTLSTTSFTHVVAVYDGTNVILYLNGQSVASGAASHLMSNTSAKLRAGAFDDFGSNAFSGALDEVAIYDHALGASRVLAHYQAGKGP